VRRIDERRVRDGVQIAERGHRDNFTRDVACCAERTVFRNEHRNIGMIAIINGGRRDDNKRHTMLVRGDKRDDARFPNIDRSARDSSGNSGNSGATIRAIDRNLEPGFLEQSAVARGKKRTHVIIGRGCTPDRPALRARNGRRRDTGSEERSEKRRSGNERTMSHGSSP